MSILTFIMLATCSLNAQTTLIKDLVKGEKGSFPFGFTTYGSDLYLNAKDTSNGFEIWMLNTLDSVVLANEIYTGNPDGFPFQFSEFNGQLIFSASDSAHGHELWSFNGLTSQLITDINPDTSSSWPDNFTIFNGALYFSANDSAHGTELWKYDGISTTLVADIYKDTNDSYPSNFIVYGGSLYFSATDSASGRELWKYNGSNVSLVSDFNPGVVGSCPLNMTIFGTSLIFSANNGTNGHELCSYNGTTISLIQDINPGIKHSYPHYFTEFNGSIYFTAQDDLNGSEVRKYDGSTVNLVADLKPGNSGSYPADYVLYDSNLYFSADDGNAGFELWYMDNNDSIYFATDITGNGDGSYPVNLTPFNGALYFQATTEEYGSELWKYIPCNQADTPKLSISDIIVCKDSSVTLVVNNPDSLHGAQHWVLYRDSLNGIALDSSINGQFTIVVDTSMLLFVRGEGCDSPGPYDSIFVSNSNISSDTIYTNICDGDSVFFNMDTIVNAGWYSTSYTSQYGCDSIVNLQVNFFPTFDDTLTTFMCKGDSILFNSSYHSSAGMYRDTLVTAYGCDSIITIDLQLIPLDTTVVFDTICEGSSIVFDGQTISSNGTYQATLQSKNTCDSIVILNLFTLPSFMDSIVDTICEGQFVNFHGNLYGTTGLYSDTLTTSNNCDSISILNLIVVPKKVDSLFVSICYGNSFLFGGNSYSNAGIYSDTNLAGTGCDSITTLVLEVNPNYNDTLSQFICSGDTLEYNNQNFISPGYYNFNLTSSKGCDSLITLEINLLPTYNDTISDTICSGLSYIFGNTILTNPGYYNQSLLSSQNCDSSVTLNLTVLNSYQDTSDISVCFGDSVFFHDQWFNSTGIYSILKPAPGYCDSAFVLNLTVQPNITTLIIDSICEGDTAFYFNQTYTNSGVYSQTFINGNGCDSTVTYDLTVLQVYQDTLVASICIGGQFNIGNYTFTSAGTYTVPFTSQYGCDSTITLILNQNPTYFDTIHYEICQGSQIIHNGQAYGNTGNVTLNYFSSYGCDSTIILAIKVNPVYEDTVFAQICAGDSFQLNNIVYNNAGVYAQTYATDKFCDSTIIVDVSILPEYIDTITTSICAGDTLQFGNLKLSNPGLYSQQFTTTNGCDSTVYLNMILNPNSIDTIFRSVCEGYSYSLGGINRSTTGYHYLNLTNQYNCDSIIVLDLLVIPKVKDTIYATICNNSSYQVGSATFNTTGLHITTLKTPKGCDSTVYLYLNLIPTYSQNLNVTICSGDFYQLGNQVLSSSGNYTETFNSSLGCDSVINLSLTVLPVKEDSIYISICSGSNYLFNSTNLSTAGHYIDTLMGNNGCDSISHLFLSIDPVYNTSQFDTICSGIIYPFGNLSLTTSGTYNYTFQSAQGCDSVVTLFLHVWPSYSIYISSTICDNEFYQLGGQQLNTSGVFVEVFQSKNGCDSIVSLNLTVYPTHNVSAFHTICEGDSIILGSTTIKTTGVYTETLQSMNGCDSLVTLTVLVNPSYQHSTSLAICDDDSIILGPQVIKTSGIYSQLFQTNEGCDSLVTLNVSVYQTYKDTIIAGICDGQTYQLGTQTLTITGIYSEMYQSINGCDSLVTVDLSVYPIYVTMDTVNVCNGIKYQFGTNWIDSTGNYSHLFSSINGCDSMVYLNFIVNSKYSDTLYFAICPDDSLVYDTLTALNQGWYQINYQTNMGCDSVVNIRVDILPDYAQNKSAKICNGSIYNFGSKVLTETGTYFEIFQTITGCDSAVTLSLDVVEFDTSVTVEGNLILANMEKVKYQWYRVEDVKIPIAGATEQSLEVSKAGTYVVKLTDGLCSAYSSEVVISTVGIDALNSNGSIFLYPNPNNGLFYIELSSFDINNKVQVELLNMNGVQLYNAIEQADSRIEMNVDYLPKGVYFVKFTNEQEIIIRKVILN